VKVIISRKGFDSSNGGVASAIMPDGTLVPFPIPTGDETTFGDITHNGAALGGLVASLTRGKQTGASGCHLDPDLDHGAVSRLPDWRPAFGQLGAAQSHLVNQGVCIGDLFLFFGWFRRVEQAATGWRYVPGSPDLHALYGWLRIGEIVSLGRGEVPSQLAAFANHPHLNARRMGNASNTLYLAADRLGIGAIDVPGGGMFRKITDARTLTANGQHKRTVWSLPSWFHPDHGTILSRHSSLDRWEIDGWQCTLTTVAIGQEFVLSTDNHEAMVDWINEIFS
jgi:hypothetical protein